MGQFTDLVSYRAAMARMAKQIQLDFEVNHKIVEWLSLSAPIEYQERVDAITEQLYNMRNISQRSVNHVNDLVGQIEQDIDQLAERIFSRGTQLPIVNNSPLSVNDDIFQVLLSHSSFYSNWQHPALIMHPTSKKWIDLIVASDPVYILYQDLAVLLDQINQYPTLYQNRLCLYTDINKLPIGQFGFVLAWEYFNSIPLDQVKANLTTIFNLLKPGGSVLCSYNNCDLEVVARRAEIYDIPFAAQHIIENHARLVGYEITAAINMPTGVVEDPFVSWVELTKPGRLTTIKAHQALGEILSK